MANKELEAKEILEGAKLGISVVGQKQERAIREQQMELQRNQQTPQE
jgi:hypothetical protein